jgi:hypothetical protein
MCLTVWAARPDMWEHAELRQEELVNRGCGTLVVFACMHALGAITTLKDGQVKLNDGVRRWMVA